MKGCDFRERGRPRGNSFFFHPDRAGSTYFFVEQKKGPRLSVFDVTDPARIKLVVCTPLAAEGAFDFVRPLGDHTELVYFRDNQKEAVLDLRKAKRPVFRVISTAADLDQAETLGESGLLATSQPYKYVSPVGRDYQVIDIAAPALTQLATVRNVRHRVTNNETGTTFLLGPNGLTVVRRLGVENDYKVHEMQMQGN